MRVMTTQAIPLQGIALVRFAHGLFPALVTFQTEAVRLLHQQKRLLALMGGMTGCTSLDEWGMNIFLLIMTAIMTSVTHLFLLLKQQPGIGGIMACVTGRAVAFSHRFVDGNRVRLRSHVWMTTQTQLRFFLAQIGAANEAMGQMAGITIFIPNRSMHYPLLEFCHHLGMAIHTGFPGLLGRCFPHAEKQQEPRNNTD